MTHHFTCVPRFAQSVPPVVTILIPWLISHGIEPETIDKQIDDAEIVSYCINAYNFCVYVFVVCKTTGHIKGIMHRPGYPAIETKNMGNNLADIVSFMKKERPFFYSGLL